ncbi:MAG: exo-beta-N-acetylmuramidase NamZ domain-containing protein [Gemmatimonadales bacterium]
MRPGIEVVLADSIHVIAGRRLGLLTNHTGIDRQGRRDVDLLLAAHVQLTVLFSPEHGLRGTEDRPGLPDERDSLSGLPIYSLYGGSRSAARMALDSIDVLLIDMQDVGARYYTYIASAVQLMREATRAGKRVVVLDRPDPIGGVAVQGNVHQDVQDPDSGPARVGFLPIAMRHGMTMGELARLANDVLGIHADLVVVPALGWQRSMFYDSTGLPWVKPSPNLPDLQSALNYPGLCLFEGTNLSVGRGTTLAFQVVGAPWLDTGAVLGRLRDLALRGVEIRGAVFTPLAPTDFKYAGVPLHGLQVVVRDRAQYDPTEVAVALLEAIRAVHPGQFEFKPETFDRLAAGPGLRHQLEMGTPVAVIWGEWDRQLARFREGRKKYLIY